MSMSLVSEVRSPASIVSNVEEVSEFCKGELEKYRGCVATAETLKDDKAACARINKLKDAIGNERKKFYRAVLDQPEVKKVIETLKSVEDRCDEIRDEYWKSVKAVEESMKAPTDMPDELTATFKVTAEKKYIDGLFARLKKDGVKFSFKMNA